MNVDPVDLFENVAIRKIRTWTESEKMKMLGIVCSLEFEDETIAYRDTWEQEIQLPDDKRISLGKYDYEIAVLFVKVVPLSGDVDVVVTNCMGSDIYSDNIGYSYTHGIETLLVDVHEVDRVCLFVIGAKRKQTSSFSLYSNLMSRNAAYKLASQAAYDTSEL